MTRNAGVKLLVLFSLTTLFVICLIFFYQDKAIDAKAHYYRAIAKDNLCDYKGAIEEYTQALSMNPNYARAYINRGYAKDRLGDSKGAIEDWEQALKLNPSDKARIQYEIDKAKRKLK